MPVTREGRLKQNLQAFERALPGALTAAGAVTVTRTQRIFTLFRPRGWASGNLVRSLTVSVPFMGPGNWMRVKVGPTAKYGWWVHFGRKPGKSPPVQAILDWLGYKHITGVYSVKTRRRIGGKARKQREDLSAAYAIATNIGKYGTKPFPFLMTGFRQSKRDAIKVFTRTLLANVGRQWTESKRQ